MMAINHLSNDDQSFCVRDQIRSTRLPDIYWDDDCHLFPGLLQSSNIIRGRGEDPMQHLVYPHCRVVSTDFLHCLDLLCCLS